jgi:hypothetical protein
MSDGMHIGHIITQTGSGSIGKIGKISKSGKIQSQGSTDPQAAWQDMIRLITALQAQVDPSDREDIDDSLAVVRQGDRAEPGALRRAIRNLEGIARAAGTVGLPALDAALKVKALLGL